MKTNWEDLSKKLGVLNPDGSELYTGQSMQALEEILGDQWIEDAIDCFIDGKKGNELAIKTVGRISSNKAAAYAYKIFSESKSTNIQRAQLALWAMNDIRMPICMNYVEECVGDKNYEGIVIGILRNLVFDGCLIYNENRLNAIFDAFGIEFADDIEPLRVYVKDEFKNYN